MNTQNKQKRPVLHLVLNKTYELRIQSPSVIETFKNGTLYKYLAVFYDGWLYTLFLDNGLDEAIRPYVNQYDTIWLKKSIKNGTVVWNISNTEPPKEDLQSKIEYPPKLEIRAGQSVIIRPLSAVPKKGESKYGPYVIFRVIHEGIEKSLFVNEDFERELLNIEDPLQSLLVERVILNDGTKKWCITPLSSITRSNNIKPNNNEWFN